MSLAENAFMAVPKFDALMLPLLEFASDGEEHRLNDAVPVLADRLGLSEADRAETIPSGASRFRNRLYWAKLYLSQAKAMDTLGAGRFRINDRGRELLSRGLSQITPNTLTEFPEFQAFMAKSRGSQTSPSAGAHLMIEMQPNETPEDGMLSAYESLKAAVVREILGAVQAADPILLSQIMVKLLLAMGYGDKDSPDSGIVLDGVNDGGVDGVVNKDRLGLSRVYIQAKRYKDGNNVGAPAIQQFSGSMDERRANEGVFVTTSDFSKPAIDSAQRLTKRIALINGQRLAGIMFELGVGVTTETNYPLKRLDSDFFSQA